MKCVGVAGLFFCIANIFLSQTAFADVPFSSGALMAAGRSLNNNGDQYPWLVASNDDGKNWAIKSVNDMPSTQGYFNASSCTGSGSSAICIAAGSITGDSHFYGPLLVVSADAGNTWFAKSIAGVADEGQFYTTSCTGDGASGICIAAGFDYDKKPRPLLVVSQDGGNTWALKSVDGLAASSVFEASSCTGSGASAVCTAVATDFGGAKRSMLVVTTDGGNVWTVKSVAGMPAKGIFHAVSCSGSGSSAVCTAVGVVENDQTYTSPLLAVSIDGGENWAVKSVASMPKFGGLNAASCTGNGASAICIAAGQSPDCETTPPFLVSSIDGGNTWTKKTVPGLLEGGIFNSTSCSGSGASAICTAVGWGNAGSNPPLLAVSTDGANTWAVKSVDGLPSSGNFMATSCAGTGASAICTAAGEDSTIAGPNPPLLAVSRDGANTWAVQSIPKLPERGMFNGAGGSF